MLFNSESQLLNYLKEKPLLLAPMAGVTDSPFRSFMREMNGGILTTELVSSVALVREETHRTQRIAYFTPDQQPIGVQIFGESADILSEAALKVEQMGASFIDLNLGCPVPKIVKKGAGSAILKDLKLLSKILKTIKSKIKIPLTIKIRTGWDEDHRNSLDVAQVASDEGCLWVTVHGRTRSQGYSGLSDWNYIAEIKAKAPLPIIGNGDLTHPRQIVDIYRKTNCDGLMIGRGCLKNPWIFNQSYQYIFGSKKKDSALNESENCLSNSSSSVEMLKKLFHYLDSFYDERMTLIQFKKLSSWFSAGCSESALFRKSIFQIKERELVLKYALDYFTKFDHSQRESVPYEPFLLQGHG